MLQRLPFANGERFDMMWGCCAGTHASSVWQNNGNDYYAGAGTKCVAPIDGTVVRAGVPGIGQGERVGIQGKTHSVYMAHMHRLRVREGQQVKAGDLLLTIEAMKMETAIRAEHDGEIARVVTPAATQVDAKDLMVEFV